MTDDLPTGKPKSRRPRKGTARLAKPTPDELAELRLRQAKAVELALAGHSYDEIAAELGYTERGGAWRAVRAALDRNEQPKVKEFRDLENARLDRLQAAWWTKALTGEQPAALIVLRIFERRAKLNGLDQQAARDAGAFAEALLGDPDARRARLIELRDDLAAKRAEKEAETG